MAEDKNTNLQGTKNKGMTAEEAQELSDAMGEVRIVDEEVVPFQLPINLRPALGNFNPRNIITRLTNQEKQKMGALISALPKIWGMYWRTRGRELGDRMAQFVFDTEADIHYVDQAGPWTFDDWFLVARRWSEGFSDDRLEAIPIWVRIKGIPLGYLSRDMVAHIAGTLGEVLEIDYDPDTTVFVEYIRVKINFNIETEHDQFEVFFKYEKLRNFCFYCGSLLHLQQDRAIAMEDRRNLIVRIRGLGAHMRVDSGGNRGHRPRRNSGGWDQGSRLSAVSSTMSPRGDTSSDSWGSKGGSQQGGEKSGDRHNKTPTKEDGTEEKGSTSKKGKGILVYKEEKAIKQGKLLGRAGGIVIREPYVAARPSPVSSLGETGRDEKPDETKKGKLTETEGTEQGEGAEEITSPLKEEEKAVTVDTAKQNQEKKEDSKKDQAVEKKKLKTVGNSSSKKLKLTGIQRRVREKGQEMGTSLRSRRNRRKRSLTTMGWWPGERP